MTITGMKLERPSFTLAPEVSGREMCYEILESLVAQESPFFFLPEKLIEKNDKLKNAPILYTIFVCTSLFPTLIFHINIEEVRNPV